MTDLIRCASCGVRAKRPALVRTAVIEGQGRSVLVCADRARCCRRAALVAEAMLRWTP